MSADFLKNWHICKSWADENRADLIFVPSLALPFPLLSLPPPVSSTASSPPPPPRLCSPFHPLLMSTHLHHPSSSFPPTTSTKMSLGAARSSHHDLRGSDNRWEQWRRRWRSPMMALPTNLMMNWPQNDVNVVVFGGGFSYFLPMSSGTLKPWCIADGLTMENVTLKITKSQVHLLSRSCCMRPPTC